MFQATKPAFSVGKAISLNPIKPPFSFGFPMVNLLFLGFMMFLVIVGRCIPAKSPSRPLHAGVQHLPVFQPPGHVVHGDESVSMRMEDTNGRARSSTSSGWEPWSFWWFQLPTYYNYYKHMSQLQKTIPSRRF